MGWDRWDGVGEKGQVGWGRWEEAGGKGAGGRRQVKGGRWEEAGGTQAGKEGLSWTLVSSWGCFQAHAGDLGKHDRTLGDTGKALG